jgi:hypothetical protein
MAQAKYDPEIDPSIREEQEAAEREREMTARIRLEIERFVAENDLVPRHKEVEEKEVYTISLDSDVTPAEKSPRQIRREEKEAQRAEEEARRAEEKATRAEKKRLKAKKRQQTVQSLLSGSFLASEQMRGLMPYLAGIALLMLLYMASMFHLQRLHRTQQMLEGEIREQSIRAVDLSAQRAQQTQRSAVVRQLESKNIPLSEYPNPLKTIEGK